MMNLEIKYRAPLKRRATNINRGITFHAFIKHMAWAGMGFIPEYMHFLKAIGGFGWFIQYLNYSDFKRSKFSLPPDICHDVTEQGQFSNIVGLALADYLVKDLNGAFITLRYEGCLKLLKRPLNISRPDLLGIKVGNSKVIINGGHSTRMETIAIEAKGLANDKISTKKMRDYKKQARAGGLPVDYHVASAAYNLYNQVKVNYYDPSDEGSLSHEEVNLLRFMYYNGVRDMIERSHELFDKDIIKLNNNQDKEYIRLKPKKNLDIFIMETLNLEGFSILVDKCIEQAFHDDVSSYYGTQRLYGENYYIDTDGIGVMGDILFQTQ